MKLQPPRRIHILLPIVQLVMQILQWKSTVTIYAMGFWGSCLPAWTVSVASLSVAKRSINTIMAFGIFGNDALRYIYSSKPRNLLGVDVWVMDADLGSPMGLISVLSPCVVTLL